MACPASGKIVNKTDIPRCIHVRFEGHVQGVGFRYTVVDLAQSHPVTGYVRNEPDGDVTLVAEGPEAALRALLESVETSRLGRYITRTSTQWLPARNRFKGFSIRT